MESHDFVGCVMELAVNGRPLEPSQALASQGILDQYGDFISLNLKEKFQVLYMLIDHQKIYLFLKNPNGYQILHILHFLDEKFYLA